MAEIRSLLYLIAFEAWQSNSEVAREAFNFQSFLTRCVRESQLQESEETRQVIQGAPLDRHTWLEPEMRRRLTILLFCFA